MLLASQGPAGAEELAAMQRGPSLHETGRMAAPTLTSPGIPLPAAEVPADARERAVEPAAVAAEIAADRAGTIDPKVLADELEQRFARLGACLGGQPALTVRFRIQRTGAVDDVEVVDGWRVAPDVLGCVKTEVGAWTFTRPRGGTLVVERATR